MVFRDGSYFEESGYAKHAVSSNSSIDTRQDSDRSTCANEPIAIIGIGCHLPGGASSASKLWDLLIEGRSGYCDIPPSRFNAKGFYHPDESRPGSVNATGGYYIDEDIRLFENSFFGINNVEAEYMDPQQRKLLEVVYECFESAGIPMHQLSNANIGCYVANFTTDYLVMQSKDPEYFHRYSATGNGPTILANRISHVFNLTGPSLVLDTACSSSLYCLHTACMALEAGECDAAVVAGANLIQSPELYLSAVKAGILSGTSTCHTFDASADGYGRAEGVGALLIKRLPDAIRDKDPIRSVIRGTAVNSNGKTNGITRPSAEGQEAVIRKAYAKAGLPVDGTDYVEAHGTGTPVGDPLEIEALSRVFQHKLGHPLLVGSVKTNLGHSEALSGITSVIKVTLALEQGLIPPTIGIKKVNPDLRLEERNVQIVTKSTAWPQVAHPRASVNSFGYGGANAHAILEPASAHVPKSHDSTLVNKSSIRSTFLLPFSTHNNASLDKAVENLTSAGVDYTKLVDLAYTLGSRRSILSSRGFLIGHQHSLDNDLLPRNLRKAKTETAASHLPLAFVFTGQGAQWPQMGCHLIKEFPTYRRTIENLDSYLACLPHPPSWSIIDAIFESAEKSKIHLASFSQTLCTATQIALVELLREWGITPEAVVGHSSGEISAAFAAGFLSASDAIAIAYYRGLVVSKSSLNGAMIAVALDRYSATQEITKLHLQDEIRVACVNSPESVTVSGNGDTIDELRAGIKSKGVLVRTLKTDGKAYHSHHMSLLGQEYEDLIFAVKSQDSGSITSPPIRMISSVTGQSVERETVKTPAYWRSNLESPVLFSDALQGMTSGFECHLIEIGPHPALELPIRQIRKELQLTENQLAYSSTLSREKNSVDSMLNLIGTLYLSGRNIDFEKVNHIPSAPITSPNLTVQCQVMHDLPKYNWHYDSLLWSESRISAEFRNRKYQRHDLLGSQIPGGNGETFLWKNLLSVKELPWLEDHKLDLTIVFPGAGYLAMAAEALYQLHDTEFPRNLTLSYRQISLLSVLALPGEEEGSIELFTQMRHAQIFDTKTSDKWWRFDISSYANGSSTVHARGLVRFENTVLSFQPQICISEDLMERQTSRSWYEKLRAEGLNFGPSFQSLTEIYNHRMGKVEETTSKTTLIPKDDRITEQQSKCSIHPVTLDAMLQTAIIASSGGYIQDLRAKVPVSIANVQIIIQGATDPSACCKITAKSETIGVGTANVNAELQNEEGTVLIRLNDIRFTPYQGPIEQGQSIGDRCPILRVLWKPDISKTSPSQSAAFTDYIDKFASSCSSFDDRTDINPCRFLGALDLVAHENSRLRILELGNRDNKITATFLKLLAADEPMKRFQSYFRGTISEEGRYLRQRLSSVPQLDMETKQKGTLFSDKDIFDLIVFPVPSTVQTHLGVHLEQISSHLASGAKILFATSESVQFLDGKQFSTISTIPTELKTTITVAHLDKIKQPNGDAKEPNIVLIHHLKEGVFDKSLLSSLSEHFGCYVLQLSLSEVSQATVPPKSIVISTIETGEPIFGEIQQDELDLVKTITDNASILLWITCGGLYNARQPDYSLVLGLSRSLMLEQPSLKVFILDIDNIERDMDAAKENVFFVLDQAMHDPYPDFEYLQHNGVLHTSRFIPETSMNGQFRDKQNAESFMLPIHEAGHCKLSIKHIGQIDTLHFSQCPQGNVVLRPDYLEVAVRSASLNEKDLHVWTGKFDTTDQNCSLEFSGIVTRAGSKVSQYQIGDHVVVMAPSRFATYAQVPEWACCKMNGEEEFAVLSSIPFVFSVALYALHHRANIQPGESVLIHSAASAVGIAAIQIAQLAGAEIFATTGTEDKKQFLVETFGLARDRIFNSRDSSFLPAILASTSGGGVDVVLNSLTKDLLDDSWRTCGELGRFVDISKRDPRDNGSLDMDVFNRSVTYTAFDLTSLYYSKRQADHSTWKGLLQQSIQMLRDGKIKPINPLKTYDVSDVVQAFRQLSSADSIGKLTVSFEDPDSRIMVVPRKFNTTFSPDKCYFLVGCLGGLGRSLAKWMLNQGASRFVFFGRSGTDRTPAKRLVEDLERFGAQVTVLRGSISNSSEVEKAVAEVEGPIGGVIHAAMGLHEALFTEMSSESWHTSIAPKVKGSWNLHKAMQGRHDQLDFFLMTSSISGSVGTATESNYCAANAFMDSFARYRRSLGLPGISVGLGMISEVGYLHEHPEIEALLLRKGIHAINEDELLQICDIALSDKTGTDPVAHNDHFAEGHILTGLEVLGLRNIRKQGFEGGNHVLDDPRASMIAGALDSTDSSNNNGPANTSGSQVPESVAIALEASPMDDAAHQSLLDAVQLVVREKMGNLLLLSADQLSPQTQLSEFGLDSMLAAEFRQFVFHTFNVDIPFPVLLADTTSVAGLTDLVVDGLVAPEKG